MGNTLLYRDLNTGAFAYYRPLDIGGGSSTVHVSSLRALAVDMREFGYLFEEPFDPDGGIPNKDWGNIDPATLRALEGDEVDTVVKFLRE